MGGMDLTGLLMSTAKERLSLIRGGCSERHKNAEEQMGKTILSLDSPSAGNNTGALELLYRWQTKVMQ